MWGSSPRSRSASCFRDYAQQWLDTYAARALKPSSQRVVRSILTNHLLPALGSVRLTELTRQQVKAFLASKRAMKTTRLRECLRILSGICTHAVDDDLMAAHPVKGLSKALPRTPHDPDTAYVPFTAAELAHYLATMQQHAPRYYPYFFLLARTGMREGEALGLTWDDIQFGTGDTDPYRFIEVKRTYDAVHQRMNSPKTGKTRRVDMSRDLRAVLQAWYQHCGDQALLHGTTEVPPVVFATATGRPWHPSVPFRVHKRICEAAGLRATRVHDLRHSFASILLYELHAPIQYVSEQLGHSSIKMTIDTYGHPRQGLSPHLVDQVDSAGTSRPSAARHATICNPAATSVLFCAETPAICVT
jgi:integrase